MNFVFIAITEPSTGSSHCQNRRYNFVLTQRCPGSRILLTGTVYSAGVNDKLLTYLELIVHEESRGFSMTEKCSSPSLTDGPRTGIVGVEGGGGNPGRRGTLGLKIV